MNVFMRYPGGRKKAVTFSFDDGTYQDAALIKLLDKYGLKATFNINGGIYLDKDPFESDVNRLTAEEATALYKDCGHEIALHSLCHDHIQANPIHLELADAICERQLLEKAFGRVINGMAYPYGAFSDSMVSALSLAGVKYGRTVEATHTFNIPVENDPMWWMKWHPTCHFADKDVFGLAEKFNTMEITCFPEMFYIWGHSYELEHNAGWEHIEKLFKTVSGNGDIWYATNIELYDYFDAYHRLRFSADGSLVYNPSALDVYFCLNGKDFVVKAGQMLDARH